MRGTGKAVTIDLAKNGGSPSPFWIGTVPLVFPAFVLLTQQAYAADPDPPENFQYAAQILTELMKVFLIATLLEQAFAVIFQWRLYQEFLATRGAKTLVMILVSGAFVWISGYNPVDIIVAYANNDVPGNSDTKNVTTAAHVMTAILSALIIAGGSAGVNTLLVSLGFRAMPPSPEKKLPPTGTAWVSVRVVTQQEPPRRRFAVSLAEIASPTTAPPAMPVPPLLGVIAKHSYGERLRRVFRRDQMRFPPTGGYSVATGRIYTITLSHLTEKRAPDVAGTPYIRSAEDVWTWTGAFAERAIADFEVELDAWEAGRPADEV